MNWPDAKKIYDLSVPIRPGMPVFPFHPPYGITLRARSGEFPRPGGASATNEVITFCAHTGTHLDALGHFSRNGLLCDGSSAKENETMNGLKRLDISETQPILAHAVLLDVAGHLGQECLAVGHGIGAEELDGCLKAGGAALNPGDVAYIRTGWQRHWSDPDTYNGLHGGYPGVNPSGAEWLADRRVRIAAADTTAFEVDPRPGVSVHGMLLVDSGIQILENANLEQLAADGVREFLTIILPLPLVGATASPVRPVAVLS